MFKGNRRFLFTVFLDLTFQDLDQKLPEEKPSQEQVAEPSAPETKPTTAELDLDRDQNLGTSDLKKP